MTSLLVRRALCQCVGCALTSLKCFAEGASIGYSSSDSSDSFSVLRFVRDFEFFVILREFTRYIATMSPGDMGDLSDM